MSVIQKTNLENAAIDATDFSSVINGDSSTTVTNRNGDSIKSVAKVLAEGEADLLNVVQYSTKSAMDSDLTPGDERIGIVTGDSTASNNAIYVKSGASGGGSWVKVAISGTAGSAASLELSEYLEIKDVNILDAIDEIDRIGVVPTVDLNAIPEDGIPQGVSFSRSSDATRFGPLGVIENISSDSIRHDYDPETGEYLGWLLEDSATNLCLQSEDLSSGSWVKVRSSETVNAAISPDGTQNADKLIESSDTGTHNAQQSISVVSGNTYTFSAFYKKAERDVCSLYAFGSGITTCGIGVDLTDGSLNVETDSASLISYGVIKYPNGWYRLYMVVEATGTGTGIIGNYINNNAFNARSYTGDGSSGIYVWGCQIEEQKYFSSYIKTLGSTVTRTPDIFTLPYAAYSPSNWYNSNEGTLYMNIKCVDRGLTQYSVNILENASRYLGFRNSANGLSHRARIRTDDGSVLDNLITATITNYNKFAFSYINGQQITAINGSVEDTDSIDANFPIDPDLHINNLDGTSDGNCWYKRVMYFPRSIDANQIKKLTG